MTRLHISLNGYYHSLLPAWYMCKAASGDTVTAIMPGIFAAQTALAWPPTPCLAALAFQEAVFNQLTQICLTSQIRCCMHRAVLQCQTLPTVRPRCGSQHAQFRQCCACMRCTLHSLSVTVQLVSGAGQPVCLI